MHRRYVAFDSAPTWTDLTKEEKVKQLQVCAPVQHALGTAHCASNAFVRPSIPAITIAQGCGAARRGEARRDEAR